MIKITRIIGSSFNLETGLEEPPSVVISNGSAEAMMSTTQAGIQSLLSLLSVPDLEPASSPPPRVDNSMLSLVAQDESEPVDPRWVDPDSGVSSV